MERMSVAPQPSLRLLVTGVLAIVSACAVGPDFHRPSAPSVVGYTPEPLERQTTGTDIPGGQSQRFEIGRDIPAQWWELFHSEPLNRLVNQALKANPSLEAARAALRQAREVAYATGGQLFPSVDAKGSVVKQKTTGAQFGNPSAAGSEFTLYNASVSVSYGLEIVGLSHRLLESAEAQADFQRFQLEAAYLTLTANVVTAAIQEASLRAQIAATNEIIKAESDQLEVLQRQLDLGATTKTNVLTQLATLSQTQATLPQLEKQLALVRNQLAVLAGYLPSEEIGATFELSSLELPRELPVSLPSRLVEQRPDIRAAEAQLHQASAQVGVATANLFPVVTLSGSFGSAATRAGDLFSSGTGIWSLGANLLQPVFHGGTLTHQRRAAIEAYSGAAAAYRNTVLTAFQNVADALRSLQSDADAVHAQSSAAKAAEDSLEIARAQYEQGAISYLSLLTTQQRYQQARLNLVTAVATRYADTAALFQALGGGWWHREGVGEEGPASNPPTNEGR
jgi:NodT family efflux transporter outer membrane factor (OMF) lipoprotein